MNVLWVEDFGGGLKADSTTLVNMFRGLLSERVFDDEWDPEGDLLSQPETLCKFFIAHSPTHKVTLLRNYVDFEQVECGFSLAFDAVALDINLSRGVPAGGELPVGFVDIQAFHNKAGFYIYNQLVRLGFPAENICFLTGEKESTFGEFSDHCQKALIPLPDAFGKDDAGLEAFRTWLADRQKSAFAQLRRGVIEGCQQVRSLIGEQPEAIQFHKFLNSGEASTTSMDDFLATLEAFLPAREPSRDDLARLMRLFVRAFAHEWENDAKPSNIRLQPGERLPHVLRAYGWVMKNTRNWLTHSASLDRLSPATVAYLFMLNLRAMFVLPMETQRYEYQLFSLFGTPVVSLEERSLRTKLEDSFASLAKNYIRLGEEILLQYDFQVLANKLEGLSPTDSNFPQLLMQILWHQLAQRKPRDSDSPMAYACDCRPFNFRMSESKKDNLHLLLRHTYQSSFTHRTS